jgi:putative phage repressor
MKENDKINLFIQFLLKSGRFASQEDVGAFLGYPNKSSFSQILKKDITSVFYNKFLSAFPEYEQFHIGIIPEESVNRVERNKKSAEKLHEVQTVPLFDSVATLGLVEVVNGAERGNVLDYISIPNLPKSDGAILVTGDSMYPLLKSGDIVALKIINIADIVFGEMHYVEYWGHDFDTEFKVVKYVKKSEKGDDFVQLVSYNQHHEPKDINIKQLKTVAIVNASIRYNRL